jgi:hypothetical protein
MKDDKIKRSKALVILAITVMVVAIALILFNRWQGQLTKDYETSTNHLAGLNYASGSNRRRNIDSAIFYYKKAVNSGGRDELRNSALVTLVKAYCEKANDSKSTRQENIDSAMFYYQELEEGKAEEGQLFVLKQLVYNNDSNWWYNEKEKKVYRVKE